MIDNTMKTPYESSIYDMDKGVTLGNNELIIKKDIDPFMSLFDYLGEAAGTMLGRAVFNAARLQNEPVGYRDISNTKYTGKVMLYKKSFLRKLFNGAA
jgi:hypothetical protein